MKAMILAAGYATRLYPLTENKPKCLLKVGGRTMLDWICDKLNEVSEIDEIILVTNAKFYQGLEDWKRTAASRAAIRVLNDRTTSNDTRLGAVGDLGFGIREAGIKTDILMMASDNLFDQNLNDFVAFSKAKGDAVSFAVYDIRDPRLAAKKFGVVERKASGEVVGMEEKPENPKSSFISMGVYYFPAASLKWVAEYLAQKNAQDAPGYYIRWLSERMKIFSFLFEGLWYDIGDFKALEEADRIFQSKTRTK